MMQRFMEAFDLRKKVAALFVVLTATCAMAMGATVAYALPSTVSPNAYSEYQITTECRSTDDVDQHVLITLKNVSVDNAVTAEAAINGTETSDPTCVITIAGRDITSSAYNRVVDVYQASNGTDAVLDLGPVGTFTAQYNGTITVSGTIGGLINAQGSAVTLNISTIIPTGLKLSVSGEGTNQLTVGIAEYAHVRGMVHLGIYNGDTLTPINPAVGNVGSYTYTIHAHAFKTMVAADYLSAIAALSLPEGYSISYTAGAGTLTITGPADAELYMGVFDDDLLQAMGKTWNGVSSNAGELNPDGSAKD